MHAAILPKLPTKSTGVCEACGLDLSIPDHHIFFVVGDSEMGPYCKFCSTPLGRVQLLKSGFKPKPPSREGATPSMWQRLMALYSADYEPPRELRLLIAGCPRGGTTYTSRMLKQFIPTSHEGIWGCISLKNYRLKPVEVSGWAGPWIGAVAAAGIPIVHLTREPAKCCTSYMNFFSQRGGKCTWEDACEFYFNTHSRIMQHAVARVRLEHWHEDIGVVKGLFPDVEWGDFEDTDNTRSAWKEPRMYWNDLTPGVQSLAAELGYGPGDL